MRPSGSSLSVHGVSKRFGSLQALSEVSTEFFAGEVHAVLGENGAGKSTLMAILGGFLKSDEGEAELAGAVYAPKSPLDARAVGVELVHQHFMLVPSLTVEENLALSALNLPLGAISVREMASRSLELAESLGWSFDLSARVGDLPVGSRQRIEIVKALSGESRVLILDEPTAVLSQTEVSDLFRVLKDLREVGRTVILIAHKLSEVMAIAHRVTVLRKGVVVGTAMIADTDETQLAEWMVGELPAGLVKQSRAAGDATVEAKDLDVVGADGKPAVTGVSFNISNGEIMGFGGVDGNGQVELAEALAGIRPVSSGTLSSDDQPAYIPQDRQTDGLALEMSISDNFIVSGHPRSDMRRGVFLNRSKLGTWIEGLVERFQIKVGRLSEPVSSLSGGNQQKIVVARTLDRFPPLLVAVNPTRGLDVHAAAFVRNQIISARENGSAVALFSTDLDELALLSDRTVFMSRGTLVEPDDAASLVGGS